MTEEVAVSHLIRKSARGIALAGAVAALVVASTERSEATAPAPPDLYGLAAADSPHYVDNGMRAGIDMKWQHPHAPGWYHVFVTVPVANNGWDPVRVDCKVTGGVTAPYGANANATEAQRGNITLGASQSPDTGGDLTEGMLSFEAVRLLDSDDLLGLECRSRERSWEFAWVGAARLTAVKHENPYIEDETQA
jgi:hypothetical protein